MIMMMTRMMIEMGVIVCVGVNDVVSIHYSFRESNVICFCNNDKYSALCTSPITQIQVSIEVKQVVESLKVRSLKTLIPSLLSGIFK